MRRWHFEGETRCYCCSHFMMSRHIVLYGAPRAIVIIRHIIFSSKQ